MTMLVGKVTKIDHGKGNNVDGERDDHQSAGDGEVQRFPCIAEHAALYIIGLK